MSRSGCLFCTRGKDGMTTKSCMIDGRASLNGTNAAESLPEQRQCLTARPGSATFPPAAPNLLTPQQGYRPVKIRRIRAPNRRLGRNLDGVIGAHHRTRMKGAARRAVTVTTGRGGPVVTGRTIDAERHALRRPVDMHHHIRFRGRRPRHGCPQAGMPPAIRPAELS